MEKPLTQGLFRFMSDPPIDLDRLRDVERRLLEDDALLPSMPEITVRIQSTMEDEATGVNEIANLIQADAALSGRMIQVANSAQFGHLPKVASVQAAIGRLGLKSVRNLAISFSLKAALLVKKPPYRELLHQVWERSVTVGAVSYILATVTVGLEADRAMLLGLLHNVGELAVVRIAHDLELDEAVIDRLTRSHGAEVAIRVLEHWRLEEFEPAIQQSGDWMAVSEGEGPDYLDLLQVARYHALMGTPEGGNLPKLTELPAFSRFPMLRLGPDMSIELLRESHHKIAEIKALLS